MRIGIVTQHPFPEGPDYRCRLIAETLAAAGHSVVVFTPACQGTVAEGRKVEVRVANRLWSAPVPFNPCWAAWLARSVPRHHLDCLLAKELRLATTVWLAARSARIPWCLDLSENYPAMVSAERAGQALVGLRRRLAASLEKFCARRANLVMVVAAANRDRLVGLNVPQERLIIVSNTPEVSAFPARGAGRDGAKLHLAFAGLLSKVRGLDRLLSALAQIEDADTRLHLHVIGDGPEGPYLKTVCTRLGLDRCVTFHGWVRKAELRKILAGYDVGVIPHLVTEHTQTTIPCKLFDYMASGLPVLTTDMNPCAEIVVRSGCGWVCGDDTGSLAQALRAVLNASEPERIARGERGRQAVHQTYHWKVDAARMLQAIENLTPAAPRQASAGWRSRPRTSELRD